MRVLRGPLARKSALFIHAHYHPGLEPRYCSLFAFVSARRIEVVFFEV